jgi:hypothetical protein
VRAHMDEKELVQCTRLTSAKTSSVPLSEWIPGIAMGRRVIQTPISTFRY